MASVPRIASAVVAINVLLVVMDTARTDAVEPYGAAAGATPSIRELAAANAPEAAARADEAFAATLAKMEVMKEAADSGKMAYDQMLGAENAEGNRIVNDVVDSLVAQARAVEGVVTALNLSIELEGSDSLAAAALDHFCLTLGSLAGDMALAHGSTAVVIGGGLGFRLADYLPRSGFRNRFVAKGRFESWMDKLPVKLITHPQPGLYGAAAAFAKANP